MDSLEEDAAAARVVSGDIKMLRSILAPPYIDPFACPVLRDALRGVAAQDWSCAESSEQKTVRHKHNVIITYTFRK